MAIKRIYLERVLEQMKLAEEAGCTLVQPISVYGAINGYSPTDKRYKNRSWYGYECRTADTGDPYRDYALVMWMNGEVPHDIFRNSVVFLNGNQMMYVTGWQADDDQISIKYFLRVLPPKLMEDMEKRQCFFFHTLDHSHIHDLEWSELHSQWRIVYPTVV